MDSYEVEQVVFTARKHNIKCKTDRLGTGEEFEYSVSFGRNLEFKDGRAAAMFVDALIREYGKTWKGL
jgi:hypothetical protein